MLIIGIINYDVTSESREKYDKTHLPVEKPPFKHYNYSMEKTDIVIIGGGPAGLTAARLLAGCGLKTVLIEKEGIGARPRSWITWLDEVQKRGYEPAIINRIDTLTFKGLLGARYNFTNSRAAILDTKKLLEILKAQAQKAGVIIKENEVFLKHRESTDNILIKTSKCIYSASYCVDASGASSAMQKKLSKSLPASGSMGCYAAEISGLKITDSSAAYIFDAAFPGKDYFWLLPYSKTSALAGCFFFEELNARTILRAKASLNKYIKLRKLNGKITAIIKGNIPLVERGYFSKGRVFFCGDSASSPLPSSGYGLLRAMDEAKLVAKEIKKGYKTGKIRYAEAVVASRYPGYELHYLVSEILKNIDAALLDKAVYAMNDNAPEFIDNFMRGDDLSIKFAVRAIKAIFSALTIPEVASLTLRRDYKEFLYRVARVYPKATPAVINRLLKSVLKG